MIRKRSFTSPIRFFGSDGLEGIKKAIMIVLQILASRAAGRLSVNLFCGKSITVSDDGEAFDIDFDEEMKVWGYNRIFNHSLCVDGTENFGLIGEEMLTLVQLVSEYMEIKTFDSEFEYCARFENGVITENELKAYYHESKKYGNSIQFAFDTALFLGSVGQLEASFFENALQELAKSNPGKEFSFCNQPEPTFLEMYKYISDDGINVKFKREKIKSNI